MKYQKSPTDRVPEVIWIWGLPGTGKTKTAVEMCGDNDWWMSSRNLKWWDGYMGEKWIIFDEFREKHCEFAELLRITDRYPYRCEVKGGMVNLMAEHIIITSCFPPRTVYNTEENIDQLLRRITKIIELDLGPEVEGNTNTST